MSNPRWTAYLLTATAAVALLGSLAWNPSPPPKYTGLGKLAIPASLEGYTTSGPAEVDPIVREALSSADIEKRIYQGGGPPIDMTLIGGTDREALHDPRSCMVGGGWNIVNDHLETLPGTNTQVRACQMVDKDGKRAGYDVLYLYAVDGKPVANATSIRWQMLFSAIIGKKGTPTCFFHLLQPLESAPARQSDAHARFSRFAGSLWNALDLPAYQKRT
jgi:hypothetical protein